MGSSPPPLSPPCSAAAVIRLTQTIWWSGGNQIIVSFLHCQLPRAPNFFFGDRLLTMLWTWWTVRVAQNWFDERRSSTATELCMALSGGRGENKQKLIKILVFVPSGSIVGLDSQCQAQIKRDISKPFVLGSPQYGRAPREIESGQWSEPPMQQQQQQPARQGCSTSSDEWRVWPSIAHARDLKNCSCRHPLSTGISKKSNDRFCDPA